MTVNFDWRRPHALGPPRLEAVRKKYNPPMDGLEPLAAFHRLLTPLGQQAVARATELAPTTATLLATLDRLRKAFPDDVARSACETAMLRLRAAAKFSRAAEMYFTRVGLEQASGEAVARYRAARYTGFESVADLCCGVGGDAIGLAAVTRVVAVDRDPLRLAMARENARAYGLADQIEFVEADVLEGEHAKAPAAYCDPDRRADGARHVRLRDYGPSVDDLLARRPPGTALGIKVAPGAPWEDLSHHDAEAEFISFGGELKECVLWFGPLKSTARRATVLPSGATLTASGPAAPREPAPVGRYLYDPDPAVVRSGLVANLGEQLAAWPIEREIAYLSSHQPVVTPFATIYEVEATLPFHGRRVGEYLRDRRVGTVTLTKRGSAVDVDALRRSWRLTGPESRTVLLTRSMGRPVAVIARRMGEADS